MKQQPRNRPDPDEDQQRLAVLIDADNAQSSVINGLLEEVARYGVASVRRIYGDFTSQQQGGWKKVLLKHSIQPVQQFAYTSGKNATDSALIIDAMDLMYTGPGLDAALEACGTHDSLVVWRLDRLGRSLVHLIQIADDLRARGARFVSITEGIDTSSIVGDFFLKVLGALAEFERRIIVERTVAGLNAARARGVILGRPRTRGPKKFASPRREWRLLQAFRGAA